MYLICNKVKPGSNHLGITELEEETQLRNQKKLKRFDVKRVTSEGALLPNYINDFTVYRSGIEGAKNPLDITGGYIIESHSRLGDYAGSFITKNGVRKSLKYPEYPTFEQVEYIQNLYDEMEDAVTSADGYNKHTGKYFADYIDVPSFAIYYLIQEYLLNRDMELASFYIYKDNDSIDTKFYAGPIWDMDGLRRGDIYNIPNCYAMRAGIVSPQNSQSASFRSSNHKGLFYYLFSHKDFIEQVKKEYYEHFSAAVEKLWTVELDSLVKFIGTDWRYDAQRWNRNQNLNYYVKEIKDFYNKRSAFIQEDFSMNEKEYYKVIIDAPEGIGYSYHLLEFHVRKGQELYLPSLGIKRKFNHDEILKLKN